MATVGDLTSKIFAAIYKALQAEGIDKDEAYDLAKRGAELLTASETSSHSSPEKPVAATICKAGDTTVSDRQHREILSKLATTRRMVLAVLCMMVALVTFTFLNTFFNIFFDLIKARRTESREARSTARRPREDMILLPLFIILFAVGLIVFMMP